MGNRRNPNEIPQKILTKFKQESQKSEIHKHNKKVPVNSFWAKLINK